MAERDAIGRHGGPPVLLPCGDTAFSVQFGDAVDRGLSNRVMRLHEAMRANPPYGVVETVPTFRSLMVHYDPVRTSRAELMTAVEPLLAKATEMRSRRRLWRLPVCYDASFALDLAVITELTGLAPQEVIERHSSTVHYVYMIGFAPGHPYMGDLPASLNLPRRENPRAEVEAGMVATAVGMTVIYPFASPSGWHLIGRTPVPMFDPEREPPVLFNAGDTVVCDPIGTTDFEAIRRSIAAGDFRLAPEEEAE